MNRQELFLKEIKEVCIKYKLCISHEDCHGSFKVCNFDNETMNWLMDASEYWDDKIVEEEEICKNCGEYKEAHERETMNCPSAKDYGHKKFENKINNALSTSSEVKE